MDGVCAPDNVGLGFGQAEIADFTLLDQTCHRADGVLDWRVGIEAVLIVEVDGAEAQVVETCLACGLDVFGFTVYADHRGLGPLDGEFRRDDHLVAPIPERLAEEFLVASEAIHVRRIEEVNP